MEIIVPKVGESITEVQVAQWLKAEGEAVRMDEAIVVIDSEKATLEVPSPAAGVLGKIIRKAGEVAKVGEVLGTIEAGSTAGAKPRTPSLPSPSLLRQAQDGEQGRTALPKGERIVPASTPSPAAARQTGKVMPSARRVMAEKGLSPSDVEGSGPGGRVLKEDVERRVGKERRASSVPPLPTLPPQGGEGASRSEEVIPLSPMRKMIAKRLVEAQSTMALLSTFNEIDMSAVMDLRKTQGDSFLAKHGHKLGFMSFFVKAAVEALKKVPQLNAEIRGDHVVYKNRYDIGVAVGGGKGLVVPVIRGAERLSFAEIEKTISEFGARAQAGKILPQELKDGTFTISNGGVYGSLLSTPIVNPPQSGILGLHAIQDRPVARDGQVVIRPMMYAALTYDHRIVDGREAVTFLKTVKDIVEKPSLMLLEL